MRISKLMMSFMVLASIATAAASASAAEPKSEPSCRKNLHLDRNAETNPRQPTVSKSSSSAKSETISKVRSHRARK